MSSSRPPSNLDSQGLQEREQRALERRKKQQELKKLAQEYDEQDANRETRKLERDMRSKERLKQIRSNSKQKSGRPSQKSLDTEVERSPDAKTSSIQISNMNGAYNQKQKMARMNDADNLQDANEEARNGSFSNRMRYQNSFQAGSPARQFQSPSKNVNQEAFDQNDMLLNQNSQQSLQRQTQEANDYNHNTFQPYQKQSDVPQMPQNVHEQQNQRFPEQQAPNQANPNVLEQNRQRVLSDKVLSKFKAQQDNFEVQLPVSKNIQEIEREFNSHLSRVYDRGAHHSGTQGCQQMITEYSNNAEIATVFIRALTDKNVPLIAKAEAGLVNFQFMQFHASLFGYMALKFRMNFIDLGKDKDPSVPKTVRRIVQSMKELFFDQNHENIRNACALSLYEILENCFINKRYQCKSHVNGKDNKKAKDLILQPLFDELQNPKNMISRQSALYVLRQLNSKYMGDPEIVNILHSHTLVALGIKHKIYDGEYLMAVVDLLNEHGAEITLGECAGKAVNHFIASIKYNMTGQNANGKVHRDQQVCASLTVLAVLANTTLESDYALIIIPKFSDSFYESMHLLNDENNAILKIRQRTIEAWKQLESSASALSRTRDLAELRNTQSLPKGDLEQIQITNQQPLGELCSNNDDINVGEQQLPNQDNYDSAPRFGNQNQQEPNINTYAEAAPEQLQAVVEQRLADHQPSFGNIYDQGAPQQEDAGINHHLQQQMSDIQNNIDKNLHMIQKKMSNIEQKVFATQKNMDSIYTHQMEVSSTGSQQDVPKANKKQEQEILKSMLIALQNQQQQITEFMQTTSTNLKNMDNQITDQASKMVEASQRQTAPPLASQDMIAEVAAAVKQKQATNQSQQNSIREELADATPKVDNKENQRNSQQAFYQLAQNQPVEQRSSDRQVGPDLSQKALPQMTYLDKKLLKNQNLSNLWLQISKYAFEQDYQTAYDMALSAADDIYLLRLIMQTGPVISRGLSESTGKKVLSRINRIVRGGIFYKLQLEWLDESRKSNVFSNLSHGEQNEYLDTLYQFANPNQDLVKQEQKQRAAEIYNILKKQAKRGYQ